ncbi:MAG: single-stranded DNA-binding protein [Alphaproteobacteria bacterium]|nr:single-stranded DNA-binding protein [Alphaproteobacteria bacterium]
MVNRVVLVGRLVKDPELRKTASDISVASFTIAVDNAIKEQDGTRGSLFLDCRVYRDQADNVAKYTRKGSKVAVDGSLNQRNFVRQDGSKGKVIEVYVDSVTFLDPNPNKENNTVVEPKFDDIPAPSSSNLDPIDLPDDDLPF